MYTENVLQRSRIFALSRANKLLTTKLCLLLLQNRPGYASGNLLLLREGFQQRSRTIPFYELPLVASARSGNIAGGCWGQPGGETKRDCHIHHSVIIDCGFGKVRSCSLSGYDGELTKKVPLARVKTAKLVIRKACRREVSRSRIGV